jgi:hypothetical protein
MDGTVTRFAFVVVGAAALALATFPVREIRAALAHALSRPRRAETGERARVFWEAAARNLMLLGAVAAVTGFVTLFSSGDDPPRIVARLGEQVFGAWILGLLLAVPCALAAVRTPRPAAAGEGDAGHRDPGLAGRWGRVETWAGYAVFAALLARLVLTPAVRPEFRPVDWLLHAPSWLLVAGGALAITLYLREPGRGRSVTLGLGASGAAGALVGLLQALNGFGAASIGNVAGGLVLALSSCVAALVGLATVGLPLEDRSRLLGARPSRLVGYGLPLATVLLVAVALIMAMTPMEMAKK